MPKFGVKKILTDDEIGLIADWLRGDYWPLNPASGRGRR
jgi:mono/diheme cytochrome c family protein